MPEFVHPGWLLFIAVLALLAILFVRGKARSGIRVAVALTLRTLTLAVLVIALAGPLANSRSRQTDVVFALDLSHSIARESVAEALDFVNRARESAARIGLVVFGADAAVESAVHGGAEPVGEITSQVNRSGTDIGRAIEVAMGAFGAPAHRRIVLLSDGQENLGDARLAAAVAHSLGMELHTVALERPSLRKEVRVQGVTVPSQVRAHEPFRVEAVTHSSEAARARLVIRRNGVLLREAEVDLRPGTNFHSFVEQADAPGLHEYEAIIVSDGDGEQENNRYQAFVQVQGPPRVLHVVGEPEAGRYLTAALTAQGITVQEARAAALPATMRELVDYDLVILNNVSGFDLSLARMELLESYVRDAGGGVVKLGGDKSYAAGGYHGTPMERLLPVTMHAKTEVRLPSLSVIFVLDRSGSMATKSRDEEKLAIAKRAALSSIELLNRFDRVGVLAFDSGQDWVVPPIDVGMRRHIGEQLRKLEAGGGTDMHAALREAHRVLRKEQAKVKHLIVLSDGITDGEKNFDPLVERISADGITISAVAMGEGAERDLMARLAHLGKGRFYHTEDPDDIPRIFTSETLTVAQDLVVEGEIRPRRAQAGEPTEGIPVFPVLRGYQRTSPKPSAQVLLRGRDEDPVLASWRYGLGKAVAFTSDLSGRWGRHWVEWPAFTRFVSQLARWTMRRSGNEHFVPWFRWRGQRGEMTVDVLDGDDRFVNGLMLDASVIDPSRQARRVPLQQVAPGRYYGAFPVPQAGRYYVTLTGRDGERQIGLRTFGLAVPYSSEYLDLGADRRLLRELASSAGGKLLPLTAATLSTITAPSPEATGTHARVWWPFFLAALVLLVAEVVVRKAPVPEAWRVRWVRGPAARQDAEAPEPEYDALRAAIARERARRLATVRDGVSLNADDPAVRARLYLSAGRNRGR
jgi:Mg-chelatase subunit ChlD